MWPLPLCAFRKLCQLKLLLLTAWRLCSKPGWLGWGAACWCCILADEGQLMCDMPSSEIRSHPSFNIGIIQVLPFRLDWAYIRIVTV